MSSGGVFNQLFNGCESSSESNDDNGLIAIFGSKRTCSTSFQGSCQTSTPTGRISNMKNSNSVEQSDSEDTLLPKISIPRVIISKRSPLPFSVANTLSISSSVSETPNLALSYIVVDTGNFFSASQNLANSGTCSSLALDSIEFRHFSLYQIPRWLPYAILQRFFFPAFMFNSGSGSSTSRRGQASISPDDTLLPNETEINLMQRRFAESVLYMHRLADSMVEGSISLTILRAANEMNFRLITEDVQIFIQLPLFYTTETQNHYRDMWLDVDNMSYEELLALEDRIGYVSTGLSEDAIMTSVKQSKYFLFAEENAQKESCSICQEDYVEEDDLGILDCGHGFHISCIKQWLRCKNICPICKSTALYTMCPLFPQIHDL